MSDFEKKFGRYAVPNLSLILVALYAVGYVIEMFFPSLAYYMTLNPWAVVHGQIWRIFTWLLIPPPSSNMLFTVIMLFFYYSTGTSMERVWGDYKYNVFIFRGILLTLAASLLWMVFVLLIYGRGFSGDMLSGYFSTYAFGFSTYYINMSIFLAFALTFPEAQVLLFFLIPVKVKWLGVIDAAYLVFEMVTGSGSYRFAIAAALLNVVILWLTRGGWNRINPREQARRRNFRRMTRPAGRRTASGTGSQSAGGRKTIHKCAICGRTELDAPDMEFRYCSKCEGSYEYCSDHLFTHIHVQKGEHPRMR